MQKDIFVIMPFSGTAACTEAQWTGVFEHVFRPAAEASGYTCERAAVGIGNLTESIVHRLRHARIVIADITDRNANVFYELGIRHALSKRTIIVSQDHRHVPSDLMGYWHLAYGREPQDVGRFKAELKRIIEGIENEPEKPDSPVSGYLERQNVSIYEAVNRQNLKRLAAFLTEVEYNIQSVKSVKGKVCIVSLKTDCFSLFSQSIYVDPGPELVEKIANTYQKIQLFETLCNLGSSLMREDMTENLFHDFLITKLEQVRDGLIVLKQSVEDGSFQESVEVRQYRVGEVDLSL